MMDHAAARLDDRDGAADAESGVLQGRRRTIRSAKYYPLAAQPRQAAVYDPRTRKMTPVDTCFSTHHLQFAEDKDNTLYFSGDTNVIGWINTRIWDETGDAAKAQGWCPTVVDTNGDGKIGAYTQPNEPPDPTQGHARGRLRVRDHRQPDRRLGLVGERRRARPHRPPRARQQSAADLPRRGLRAAVQPAAPNGITGYTPRGIDVDRNGVHLDRAVGRTAPGVVRPPQVQDAERTDRHRPALPRRLDAVSGARSADEGHRPRRAAPTSRTTTGSISSTRSASARTCRS